MFEKEAEEIANKRCHEIMCFGHCSFSSPKHHRCGEWHREYNCAKEGIEFGYNKANEWHYVKDGNLPECEEYVWCLFKNAQFPFIAKLYFGMADNDFHWKCLTTNEEYNEWEVYAWKEIVLPKESE